MHKKINLSVKLKRALDRKVPGEKIAGNRKIEVKITLFCYIIDNSNE
jgi:hypothetical protein